MLDSERCILYIYEAGQNALTTKAIRGAGMDKFSVSADRGIVGLVYRSCKGTTSFHPSHDSRFDSSLDSLRKSSTRNIMCVPLKSASNCIGCIEMSNKMHSEYTEEDFNLLNCVAKELALGLIAQNRKEAASKPELKDKVDQIANSNLLTPLLKNTLIILAEILKAEKYVQVLNFHRILVYLKSSYDNSVLVSEVSSSGIENVTSAFDINAGCAGIAFRTSKPVFESDIKSEEYPAHVPVSYTHLTLPTNREV
eukprot:TRINITY_DN2582_c0_g1_i11.p1 TRINITY_DN2582_c0_g1~~TRINITY_DN2582_c0_g1_i11.p1  ORF type:complete len:253 (-),score=50.29 TRINITY_DN2582_c0_g1_i11:47-805(-)